MDLATSAAKAVTRRIPKQDMLKAVELGNDVQTRTSFGRAISSAMRVRNVDDASVAVAVGASVGQLEAWTTGRAEPSPTSVFRLEQILGLLPGELSQHLGYVPVERLGTDRPLADVLEGSQLLDAEDKQFVSWIVRLLVARHHMRLRVAPASGVRARRRTSGTRVGYRPVATGSTLHDLRAAWTSALAAEGATRNTIENYRSAVEQLRLFLAREDRTAEALAIRPMDIEEFLADLLTRNTVRTAMSRYRALRVFFAWAEEVGEIMANPMMAIQPPVAAPRGLDGRLDAKTPAHSTLRP